MAVVGGNRRIRREDLLYSAVSILDKGVERQQQDFEDETSLGPACRKLMNPPRSTTALRHVARTTRTLPLRTSAHKRDRH